jgi:hypothetical protein
MVVRRIKGARHGFTQHGGEEDKQKQKSTQLTDAYL